MYRERATYIYIYIYREREISRYIDKRGRAAAQLRAKASILLAVSMCFDFNKQISLVALCFICMCEIMIT